MYPDSVGRDDEVRRERSAVFEGDASFFCIEGDRFVVDSKGTRRPFPGLLEGRPQQFLVDVDAVEVIVVLRNQHLTVNGNAIQVIPSQILPYSRPVRIHSSLARWTNRA